MKRTEQFMFKEQAAGYLDDFIRACIDLSNLPLEEQMEKARALPRQYKQDSLFTLMTQETYNLISLLAEDGFISQNEEYQQKLKGGVKHAKAKQEEVQGTVGQRDHLNGYIL